MMTLKDLELIAEVTKCGGTAVIRHADAIVREKLNVIYFQNGDERIRVYRKTTDGNVIVKEYRVKDVNTDVWQAFYEDYKMYEIIDVELF